MSDSDPTTPVRLQFRLRTLLLLFVFVSGAVWTVWYQPWIPPKFTRFAETQTERRRQRIEREIASLPGHSWAGRYYCGDGLGVNVTLSLAPQAGFAFEWHGCLGTYDRNYGSVTLEADLLRLHLEFANDREGFQGIDEEFIPICWGGRSYLIPPDALKQFAAAVATGDEPRSNAYGSYSLRIGDENKPVTGLPELPARYRAAFLAAMTSAAIQAAQVQNFATFVQPIPLPEQVKFEWQVAKPESTGFDTAPIEKLTELIKSGEYKNIHGVLVVKNRKLVVEEYFAGSEEDGQKHEYDRETKHGIHSATKSINGLLFGIAIEQRLIRDVDAKISTFFPEYAAIFKDQAKDAIRLKHLLSMTAGLEWNESVPYTDPRNDHVAMNASSDPVRYVLERPVVAAPGTTFNYSSGVSIVLGEILHKISGVSADQFADRHLFKPLDITDFYWLKYPNGIVQTGGGLSMRPRDMAKIGQLMLDSGRWNDAQLVSKSWTEESAKKQAPDASYGYQWWLGSLRAGDRTIPTYAAQGRGGQFILVLPERKIVAVFTGWNDDETLRLQPLDMMRKYILPADREAAAISNSDQQTK